MSTQITEDLESVSINSMCIKIEEPSREDYFRHENYKCSCSLNPLSMKKHVPCVILHFLEKQAILNKFQNIMEQNKCLQLEKSQLKSANDLTLNNIGHIQEENDHLHSKVSKLTNELEIKKTIFFSKEKRFLKIIDELQSYKSLLENTLREKTASVPEPSKTTTSCSASSSSAKKVSIYLDSTLNDSFLDKFEKIEKRIESLKAKSIDTYLKAHPQLTPMYERKSVSIPDDILNKFVNQKENTFSFSKNVKLNNSKHDDKDELDFDKFMDTPHVFDKDFENKFQSSGSKTKFAPTSVYSKKSPKPTKIYVNHRNSSLNPKDSKKASTSTKSSVKSSSPKLKCSSSYFSKSESASRFKVTENNFKETITRYHDQYGWFVHDKKPKVSSSKDKQVWRPKVTLSKKSTKSFKYSFSKLFELAPRNVRLGVQKLNDFVQKSPPVFKSPLIPRDLFQAKTSSVKSQWNSTSLHHIDTTYKWFAKVSKTIGPVLRWVPKVVLK